MPNYKGYKGITIFFLSLLYISSVCHSFVLLPMPCNVSLTNSCPASLYYVPSPPKNSKETAALFAVPSSVVAKTADGFLIRVSCSCPADHKEFVWSTGYTVQPGDTWKVISGKFGLLVLEKPQKELLPSINVTLDFLCGCVKGVQLVTYTIQQGDTLYTICSRFGVDMEEVVKLNKVSDKSLIYAGDKLFIPAKDLAHLIVPEVNGSDAPTPSRFHNHIVLGIAVAAVVVVLILVSVLLRIYYTRRRQKQIEASSQGLKNSPRSFISHIFGFKSSYRLKYVSAPKGPIGSSTSSKSVKTDVFPYSEVCDATSNFSESQKIGQGSYGSVYRGKLRGLAVAVKKMNNTKSKEFFAELNILCKVYHSNLVKLIGYSAGAVSLCLVYEFAENGTLSDHLHNPSVKGHKPLSWSMRVQIAVDVAKGLEHIHVHIKPFYVHRDIKPSNILLDSSFNAKVADFGLVKLLEHSPEVGTVTSKIVGTFGYLAPEYVRDGCVTPKADVYAYGVVLMELITSQRALTWGKGAGIAQYSDHQSVVDFVLAALDGHDPITRLVEIVDPNLIHYDRDSLLQVALLSKDCINNDWRRRPDMSEVVLRLSEIASNMDRNEIRYIQPTY